MLPRIADCYAAQVPARPKIVLFDLDGTLVLTGGAGRRAMRRAFDAVCGRGDALDGVDFRGMTDRAIFRVGLGAAGYPTGDDVSEALRARYLAFLAEEVPRSPRYTVLPGVERIVAALHPAHTNRQLALGLGTGNFQDGARIKLRRAGLDVFFAFGGFGCDGEDRTAVIDAGVVRGAKHLGREPRGCAVWIVGDTPRDVHAAHAVGGVCLAVGTGGYSEQALRDAGAEHFVPDLRDQRALDLLAP